MEDTKLGYENIIKVKVAINNNSSVRLSVNKDDAETIGMAKSGELWFIKVLGKVQKNKIQEEMAK